MACLIARLGLGGGLPIFQLGAQKVEEIWNDCELIVNYTTKQ